MIESFLDTDLYKITMQAAVCKLYPREMVEYTFINRGGTKFPEDFGPELRSAVNDFARLGLTDDEQYFLRRSCPYLSPVYLDFLYGYRYDPSEVFITQVEGNLEVSVVGYWYRTILWEVPLMAMISELYFKMIGREPDPAFLSKTTKKGNNLHDIGAKFADFGTRRRFSSDVHKKVVRSLRGWESSFVGTSNVRLAMEHDLKPIGTQAHEWFMFHGAKYGYQAANSLGLKRWVDVYDGNLGVALSDTYTSEVFFQAFGMKYAKLFDGIRQDSGDPLEFADKAIAHYKSLGIDPTTKTIVFSDGLDVGKVKEIHAYCEGRIRASYGIGTNLTNDVGVKPLNIVIKMKSVGSVGTVKLSDEPGKHTGDKNDIRICKETLGIET